MAGEPTPFARRKAKKKGLKPFGSKKKGGAKVPPAAVKKPPAAKRVDKPNPFKQRALRKQEVAKVAADIERLMSDYDVAFAEETRLFAKLSKTKPGSKFYTPTERKWNDAMTNVERIQQRLLATTMKQRKLMGKKR